MNRFDEANGHKVLLSNALVRTTSEPLLDYKSVNEIVITPLGRSLRRNTELVFVRPTEK